MRGLLFGIVGWLAVAIEAQAVDWYVNNLAGDDHHNGLTAVVEGTENGPFQTITRALIAAGKADRVIVENSGEPYRESITLQAGRHSGFERVPFELIGNGVVLEGMQPIREDSWEHVRDDVFRMRPPRMAFQTFFLGGTPATRVRSTDGLAASLQPREWTLADSHIYFRTEPNLLPYAYAPQAGGFTVGITLYEVRHVRIVGFSVRGFQLDGVNAHNDAHEVVLEKVTSNHNGRSGISVGGCSRVELVNCSAKGNGAAQVRLENQARLRITGGNFDAQSAPQLERTGGRVIVDP